MTRLPWLALVMRRCAATLTTVDRVLTKSLTVPLDEAVRADTRGGVGTAGDR